MTTTTMLVTVTAFVLLPATWLSLTATIPVDMNYKTNLSLLYETDESEDCTSNEEFVSPYEGRPRCCSMCDPGHGMVRLCTDTNDTACGPCKLGKEYSSVRSAREKCQPCTVCHNLDSRAKTLEACTPTSDTVCGCIPGYYFHVETQSCRACSKCPAGQGVSTLCSKNADTECSPCPPGSYSDLLVATVGCMKCRECPKGAKEVRKCSAKENTLCCSNPPCDIEKLIQADRNRSSTRIINAPPRTKDRSDPSNWREVVRYDGRSNNTNESPPPNKKSNSVTSNDLIPLYCAIMSLVIITLVLYVVFKWWRRRQAAGGNKGNSQGGSLLGGGSGPVSVFSSGKRKVETTADVEGRVGLINFSKEGSPCVMMTTSNSPSHGTKRIADLSPNRMRQIEEQLSQEKSGNGWAALAKALDYSPTQLSQFESQADLHREPPVRFLLQDYADQSCATVAHMTKALQKCGRTDVIPLLKEHSPRLTPPEPQECLEMGHV